MIKIYEYGSVKNEEIFSRVDVMTGGEDVVADIIYNVSKNGDKALVEYEERFDKAKLSSLLVSETEIDEAFSLVDKRLIEVCRCGCHAKR